MKAYILSTYGEDGAEEVHVTLDKEKVMGIASEYGEDYVLDRLIDVLSKDTTERDGVNVSQGWGGLMIHIIEVE